MNVIVIKLAKLNNQYGIVKCIMVDRHVGAKKNTDVNRELTTQKHKLMLIQKN